MIHLKIFSFLDQKDVRNCLSVCKKWYQILEEDKIIFNFIWKEKCITYSESLKELTLLQKGPQNFKLLLFEEVVKDNINKLVTGFILKKPTFDFVLNKIIFFENLLFESFPYISPERYEMYKGSIKEVNVIFIYC